MPTDHEKFEELGKKVLELRETLPHLPNEMSEEQLKQLWDLIDEQYSYIGLLIDE